LSLPFSLWLTLLLPPLPSSSSLSPPLLPPVAVTFAAIIVTAIALTAIVVAAIAIAAIAFATTKPPTAVTAYAAAITTTCHRSHCCCDYF
jgi:hypothetical protein